MSVGNLKDSGNQGNNFPWQLKMLQGLQQIADILSDKTLGAERKAVVIRLNTTYVNSVNTFSFSVANVGSGNGIVNGETIKPGEIVNFDASALNNYFAVGAINIDGTGTELLTSFITA